VGIEYTTAILPRPIVLKYSNCSIPNESSRESHRVEDAFKGWGLVVKYPDPGSTNEFVYIYEKDTIG
jgi:hypothetical protein